LQLILACARVQWPAVLLACAPALPLACTEEAARGWLDTRTPANCQAARLKASQQLVADLVEDQRTHAEQHQDSSGPASTSDQQQEQLPKHKQLEHALRRCSPIMVNCGNATCCDSSSV